MSRAWICSLLTLALCAACLTSTDPGGTGTGGPAETTAATSPGSTSSVTTEGGASGTSSGAPTSTGSGSGSNSSTYSSISFAGDVGGLGECDVWSELSCPKGQKCMPYSSDGEPHWDAVKCVPLAPDPRQDGDVCSAPQLVLDGLDDCDDHTMCWNIDPGTHLGICHSMCLGSPDEPACTNPGRTCDINDEGVRVLCLRLCDPLAPGDCAPTEVCAPDLHDTFTCAVDASGAGGQLFAPCEGANTCDPELACVDPSSAAECDPQEPGCCLPFCDLTQMGACPNGLACNPWYDPGPPPPGYEKVGICGVP